MSRQGEEAAWMICGEGAVGSYGYPFSQPNMESQAAMNTVSQPHGG
jgi:hypothetical protein